MKIQNRKLIIAKKAILKNTIKKILDQINNGGATFNTLLNKDYSGTRNFAVSPFPERTQKFRGKATLEMATNYCNSNSDLFRQYECFVPGAWFNTNNSQTYFDVTALVPLEKKVGAIALAKKANQIAIFDLCNFLEIKLGGTGELDSTISPFNERLKEALILGSENCDENFDSIPEKDEDGIDIIPTNTNSYD